MNTSNFINLIGRLGEDPKTRTLDNGNSFTEFSLATKDFYRDRDGNRQERTEWHTVKAFGKLAELFDQYLKRGEQVSIVGSMRYSKWIDKHQQNRISANVIADSFSFIGTKARPEGNDHSASLVADPLPDASRALAAQNENRRVKTAVEEYEPMLEGADDGLPF